VTTTYDWRRAVSGSWNTADNWIPRGGPQVAENEAGLTSFDPAVFATGSTAPYTVSGYGIAQSMTVAHDHVTFNNFRFENPGGDERIFFTVNSGAVVTVAPGSDIDLIPNNPPILLWRHAECRSCGLNDSREPIGVLR
jgi:hypothetical protein